MRAYELWIGARYAGLAGGKRKQGRGDRFVSFIAASSMVGISLGVAALIIVLSVMNGFQTQVRDRMLSVLPHVELYLPQAELPRLEGQWRQVAEAAGRVAAIEGAAPFVSAQGMLVRGQALTGAQMRGIDPAAEQAVSELAGQMVEGDLNRLQPGAYQIVLGRQLAGTLGVGVGDTVLVLAPQGAVTPAGFSPRMRQFTVGGLFSSGHYEFDSSMAFLHYDDAARVFRDSSAGGVRLRLPDMHQAPRVARSLRESLPGAVYAQDWTQNNRTWFAAVQTEKRMMFLILTLIVAVAAFNLLSSLVMAVKDKRADIAILRTLGATPREIGRIFLVQGALIGTIGTGLGVLAGMAVAYNVGVIVPFIEGLFGIEFLPQQIYFISAMPSNPQASDIIAIGLTSLVLSLLATLYPSWRASTLQPAEVLRHD